MARPARAAGKGGARGRSKVSGELSSQCNRSLPAARTHRRPGPLAPLQWPTGCKPGRCRTPPAQQVALVGQGGGQAGAEARRRRGAAHPPASAAAAGAARPSPACLHEALHDARAAVHETAHGVVPPQRTARVHLGLCGGDGGLATGRPPGRSVRRRAAQVLDPGHGAKVGQREDGVVGLRDHGIKDGRRQPRCTLIVAC